jgi:predicted RNase H-like HicB family nuclease
MFTRNVLVYRDPESDYWIVECPSLPGCVSQGKTREEAINNIKEAIEVYVEVLIEDGRSIPVDTVETIPVTVTL